MTRRKADRNAAEQIEWMRNLLAFMLVGSFVGMLPALMMLGIPKDNEQLITYMLGQLSGMAITVLGFYFMDKVGQAAIDAKKSENTNELAKAVNKALDSSPLPAHDAAVDAAEQTAAAAVEKSHEIAGDTKEEM